MSATVDRPDLSELLPVSVVIPAHNEESVIERCLGTLTAGASPGELDVVVVCNGCTDRTAAIARGVAGVRVVELDVASKAAALNAGDDHATHFPRIYLDADIELSISALRAAARTLTGNVLCAAPTPVFEVEGRSMLIRDYYRVWGQLPYLTDAMVGTGVYALSESGRDRFERFPPITADDQFVLQQFERGEREALADHHFVVHTPTTLRGLFAIRRRAYRGTTELASSGLARHEPAAGSGGRLLELARSPRNWLPVATFIGISVAAKAASRWGRHRGWERDESARRVAATPLAQGENPGPG